MTQKTLNRQFGFVASFGIFASCATEIWPDKFYWLMPFGIAFLRLFIIAYTSRLKELYPDEQDYFGLWSWGTTFLIAGYILHLWLWAENPIRPDVHWSLQVLNIVLVGTEYYYGKLMLSTDEVKTIDFLQAQIYSDREEIETHRKQIEADRLTIETHREKIEAHRLTIESNRQRIGSLESEIGGLILQKESDRLRIDKLKKQIEPANEAIELRQSLIGGYSLGSRGTLLLCNECGDISIVGHKAKTKECKNGHKL